MRLVRATRPWLAAAHHPEYKPERWTCQSCFSERYTSRSRTVAYEVRDKQLSGPNDTPIRCEICGRLVIYYRKQRKHIGRKKAPQRGTKFYLTTVTIVLHTMHPVSFVDGLRVFMAKNKDPYEISYKKVPLPKEKP